MTATAPSSSSAAQRLLEGFRDGLLGIAEETSSSTGASPSPGEAAWNVRLIGEHVRHTGRLYAFLGIAGVCAAPVVYLVAYGGSRQKRAALIDAAAAFEQRSEPSSGAAAKEAGAVPHPDRRGRYGYEGADDELPPSGEDGDLVVSAASRAVVVAAQGGGGTAVVRAPSRAASTSSLATGQEGPAVPPTAKPGTTLTHMLQPFFGTVLTVKHASNHVFGATCARAVLAPYFGSLARYLSRGLIINLTVHAAMFGLCAFLDAYVPLSSSADTSAPSLSSSEAGADAHEGVWHAVQQRLSCVWRGLTQGRTVLTGSLPTTAALPVAAHLSWTTLYDFTVTTRFAALGYWSAPVMRACALWWCVLGKSGAPWQRTSPAAVQAAVRVWNQLSPCGLFLVGVLGAVHTRVRRLARAHWGHVRCHSCPCAPTTPPTTTTPAQPQQQEAGEEPTLRRETVATGTAADRQKARPDVSKAAEHPHLRHAAGHLGCAVAMALLQGLGVVLADYVLGSIQQGGEPSVLSSSGGGGGPAPPPPLTAILYSVLSLR